MKKIDDIIQDIESADKILIYGAAIIAEEAVNAFSYFYLNKIVGCAVTDMRGNPSKILNIPVKSIYDYDSLFDKSNTVIILAMRKQICMMVKDLLVKLEYKKIYEYDGELKNFIRSRLFKARLADFQKNERVNICDKSI